MPNRLIAARNHFTNYHPEERIVISGREWGYVKAGDHGPALLLIPGTLGRGEIFWQQIEALQDRARIVAVTYPKSGGVPEWASDLAELCGRLAFDRFTVLGSSLGGYLAQYLAAAYPHPSMAPPDHPVIGDRLRTQRSERQVHDFETGLVGVSERRFLTHRVVLRQPHSGLLDRHFTEVK